MKIRGLPRRHREHRAGQVGRAETHGVAEEGRDERRGHGQQNLGDILPHPLLFVKCEIKIVD